MRRYLPRPAGLALERQRPGLVTRGLSMVQCRVQRGCYRLAHSSPSTFLLAAVVVLSLVVVSVAPPVQVPAAQGVDFVGRDNPPAVAAREWLLGYAGIYDVLADPTPQRLSGLAEHLLAQPELPQLPQCGHVGHQPVSA